jgi:23S rRNA pseudouridine2605 synthase
MDSRMKNRTGQRRQIVMSNQKRTKRPKEQTQVAKKRKRSTSQTPKEIDGPVRLNRYIARAGICSRRKADELISDGRVKINGDIIRELGTRVGPSDHVVVNGREIRKVESIYLLVNKSKDIITTVSDEKGRRTILDLITRPELHPGLFPVGRLDRDTTGAILMTTDGELANRLMHPSWTVEKIYMAHTKTPVSDAELELLRTGVMLDDGPAKADMITRPDESDKTSVAVQLHEGRNRQLRRMFEAIGHEVSRLDRIRYAGLALTDLKRGRWRRLTPREVQRLRKLVRL